MAGVGTAVAGALSKSIGASLSAPLSQSYSSGGSANQAANGSELNGYSLNYPVAANANAAAQADLAFQRQLYLNALTMDYNSREAEKQRNWQEEMANTIYTRSVKNMREAGINPVLAAGMGLSGANVSSGATASFGGSTAPLATSFMGSESANSAHSWGESQGSSWSQSEGGIITALEGLAGMFKTMADTVASSSQVKIMIEGLEDMGVDASTPEEIVEAAGGQTKDNSPKNYIKSFAKGILGGLFGAKIP